ncbi:MAG: hypothetical protein HYR88_05265 [Verrucomicrobia bacterium]|nr:hypothetical protein [Verrucomicrobiota bacterium]
MRATLWALLALASFHLAHSLPSCRTLILLYPFALVQVIPLVSRRVAFYGGLALGLLLYAPQLQFFWTLFGAAAAVLWLILATWLAVFLLLSRSAIDRWGPAYGALALPFLWTGLEYARSELYPLRFSWANASYPIGSSELRPLLSSLGMYGVGFVTVALGGVFWASREPRRRIALGVILTLAGLTPLLRNHASPAERSVQAAGMQLEETPEAAIIPALDRLAARHPDAELLVLHEYLLSGEVPENMRRWCLEHQRWLLVGGKRQLAGDRWQNTAFVVGTNGSVVFEQGKKTPIQFFNDGISAPTQKLWQSPWGKIGIAICYDLSYTRVTDELVRQGAQALIIPTMDAIEWGPRQHELHALVAPTRACEYGIPILRVASSGISQFVRADGSVESSAPCPGPEATLSGTLRLGPAGRLPMDRYLAPFASGAATILAVAMFLPRRRRGDLHPSSPPVPSGPSAS